MTDLVERLRKQEHHFLNAVEGEYTANCLRDARFEIERQAALLREAREALDEIGENPGSDADASLWFRIELARATFAKLENADV